MDKKRIVKDIDRVKSIIEHIEKRTDKGDVGFMCQQLYEKIEKIKEEIEN